MACDTKGAQTALFETKLRSGWSLEQSMIVLPGHSVEEHTCRMLQMRTEASTPAETNRSGWYTLQETLRTSLMWPWSPENTPTMRLVTTFHSLTDSSADADSTRSGRLRLAWRPYCTTQKFGRHMHGGKTPSIVHMASMISAYLVLLEIIQSGKRMCFIEARLHSSLQPVTYPPRS